MTIRKKLILSNILMILVPALFALIFGAAAFKTYGNRYWQFFEEILEDTNGVYSAQSIVCKYAEDLEEESWTEYEQIENSGVNIYVNRSEAMNSLEKDLLDMGYHFRLRIDGNMIFSSITEEEEGKIEEYFEGSGKGLGNLTLNEEELSLIKHTFENEGEIFEIVAVRTGIPDSSAAKLSYFQRYVVAFAAAIVLLVGLVILATNAGLSVWIVRSIMKPLRILEDGTKRIADGDLEWTLDYHEPNEFGAVCGEFEKMRGQLKESVETRLRYEQYRRELIAGISHDLRTPLTSIKGYTEGLQDGIADTEEKRKRYYEAIHIRALDMESLVDSLSVFSRLENRQHRYFLEDTDMKAYLEKLLKEYAEEAAQKQAVILLDCRTEHTGIRLDVQEMHRVFVNLFENSVKYRLKERSVIRITMESRGKFLEIRVADDGPGVPDDELSRIFDSFYRGDESRTKPGNGSGLGLAIVRQIVEGHGGTIHAENDRGLVVVIRLPLIADKGERT